MAVISSLATPYHFESFVNIGDERWSSRDGTEITTVVIHHMALTNYDLVPEIWRQREASAHYGIGPNGEIRAYVGEEKRAWHASEANAYSIGIENCNITTAPDWRVSDKTIDSIVRLIQDINKRYGRNMEIIGHKCAPGNSTECPGPYLTPRLSEIIKRVEEDEMRYNTINEVPEWGRETIQMLINKGLLQGDGDKLNLSEDMIRIFVINDRAGLYK